MAEQQPMVGDAVPEPGPAAPASPPLSDDVETPEDRHEGGSAEEAQSDARKGKRIGRPFSSEEGAEAARKRWGESRATDTQTSATQLEGLRKAATAMYDIVTGPKSVTPANRIAATKAYQELQLAVAAAEEREQGAHTIPWDEMSHARRTVLRWVIEAKESTIEWLLRDLEGEARQRPGGTPHPP